MAHFNILRNPNNTYRVTGPDGPAEMFRTHGEAATNLEDRELRHQNPKQPPILDDDLFDA
jgi:hypothetical protein